MLKNSIDKTKKIENIAQELGLTKLLAQLLLDRGINSVEEAKDFLDPKLRNLENPDKIPNIYIAAEKIYEAVESNKKICVYGDYDLDGISSTALLTKFLRDLAANVIFFLPDRVEDGYSLNCSALDYLKKESVDLVITVDCGITNIKEVLYAKEIGLEVIITDHHEAKESLPEAIVVDPKVEKNNELSMLAGVGVAFYLIIALRKVFREKNSIKIENINILKYLWFVAIGTIADMMPLLGTNRILVAHGLKQINTDNVLAISILSELDPRIKKGEINTEVISFLISPKLNSAGRISNPKPVLELFLTDNIDEARTIIRDLDECNKERINLQNEALEKIKDYKITDIKGIPVFYDESFHQGVIGILSSRLTKEHKRPVLVCANDKKNKDILKCSFRSYNGVDLISVIESLDCPLLDYGGHKGAAGFSLSFSDLERLKSCLSSIDYKSLEEKECEEAICIDFEDINTNLIEELLLLEPFGQFNKKPLFKCLNLPVKKHKVLKDKHVKLFLENSVSAIGFNFCDENTELDIKTDTKYTFYLEFNNWNGKRNLQLNLVEMG